MGRVLLPDDLGRWLRDFRIRLERLERSKAIVGGSGSGGIITSLQAGPSGTPIVGAAEVDQGAGIALTESGQIIRVDNTGVLSLKVGTGGSVRTGNLTFKAGDNTTITDNGDGSFTWAAFAIAFEPLVDPYGELSDDSIVTLPGITHVEPELIWTPTGDVVMVPVPGAAGGGTSSVAAVTAPYTTTMGFEIPNLATGYGGNSYIEILTPIIVYEFGGSYAISGGANPAQALFEVIYYRQQVPTFNAGNASQPVISGAAGSADRPSDSSGNTSQSNAPGLTFTGGASFGGNFLDSCIVKGTPANEFTRRSNLGIKLNVGDYLCFHVDATTASGQVDAEMQCFMTWGLQ